MSFLLTILSSLFSFFFFFNDTATTEIYTLSLHDALPISCGQDHRLAAQHRVPDPGRVRRGVPCGDQDRKSTRLNSSHLVISYAVFCLKKKKNKIRTGCTVSEIPFLVPRSNTRHHPCADGD